MFRLLFRVQVMNRYYEGAFGPVENVTKFFETRQVHEGNVVSADRVFMTAKQLKVRQSPRPPVPRTRPIASGRSPWVCSFRPPRARARSLGSVSRRRERRERRDINYPFPLAGVLPELGVQGAARG